MNIRKIHYISGIVLTFFIGLHLLNHCYSLLGPDQHIAFMSLLRQFYRHALVESILLSAVIMQIFSGLKLLKKGGSLATRGFERLQAWSGLYLALFLIIHLLAVAVGRLILHLDTNFYFGVAGLNSFPVNVFFIPYYGLAVVSFFTHVAGVHDKKMKKTLLGMSPRQQSKLIILFGVLLTVIIFYGLTNQFKGYDIPNEYHILMGK